MKGFKRTLAILWCEVIAGVVGVGILSSVVFGSIYKGLIVAGALLSGYIWLTVSNWENIKDDMRKR
jgi:hypothetical protein